MITMNCQEEKKANTKWSLWSHGRFGWKYRYLEIKANTPECAVATCPGGEVTWFYALRTCAESTTKSL